MLLKCALSHRSVCTESPLGDSTALPLCRLNAASCSWYAWNSVRLKQTQAGNKQPRSSSAVHPAPATSPRQSSPFTGGNYKTKPAAKPSQPCCSNFTHLRPAAHSGFSSFTPSLCSYTALTGAFVSCRSALSPQLSALFLNPRSIRGKKKVPQLV